MVKHLNADLPSREMNIISKHKDQRISIKKEKETNADDTRVNKDRHKIE